MSRSLATIAAALTIAFAGNARAESFAGLADGASGFAQVRRDKALAFPRDHGAHTDYRTEWWYLTANLTDESGFSYGVQWTLFRQALTPQANGAGWANGQLWLAHAAVTSGATHLVAEKFARGGVGQAGVEAAPFRAFIDDWSFTADGDRLANAHVAAHGADFEYRLDLVADGPLVLHGEAGYSRKSDGPQASYYYSQPYFSVAGVLQIQGSAMKVSGRAWMDREWSSQQLAPNQKGWDWFSLHFTNGEKLMLYRMRDETPEGYLSGTWIGADGATQLLGAGDIRMTPLAETRIEGRMLPTRWRLSVARRGLDIETTPLNPQSWMKTSFPYWEGPIVFTGSHKGVGYLEMTGTKAGSALAQ